MKFGQGMNAMFGGKAECEVGRIYILLVPAHTFHLHETTIQCSCRCTGIESPQMKTLAHILHLVLVLPTLHESER